MPELVALTRLVIARSRLILLVMIAVVVIGVATSYVVGPQPNDSLGTRITIMTLFCTMLPAAFASIVLFDYSIEGQMNLPESGCSHWILRMPIHSWKIAAVPLFFKTLWVTALWCTFVFVCRYLGVEEEIPVFAPGICLAATAIWVLAIAWRPYRSVWHRLVALAIVVPILYCCIVGAFVAPHINQVEWRSTATWVSYIGVVLLYLIGVWVTIHAVALARTNMTGIVPERGNQTEEGWLSGTGFFGTGLCGRGDHQRYYRSPVHTLVSHELIRYGGWVRKTLVVGVIPAIIFFALFVPVMIGTVVLALWVFAYLAAIAISRTSHDPDPALPPYLVASPMSSATIAWTRFATPMAVASVVFSSIVLLFAAWGCWPENRAAWLQWASLRARDVGSTESVAIGLRWSAAILIGSAVFALGRLASYFWFGMTGRKWLAVTMAIVSGLAFLVPLGVVLGWFTKQPDFESAKASALFYAGYLPAIVIGLLIVKALATGISFVAIRSQGVVTDQAFLKSIVIWAVITLSVATSLSVLIPDPRATYLWCLAFTALSIPLTRVLILPASLAWNRHR